MLNILLSLALPLQRALTWTRRRSACWGSCSSGTAQTSPRYYTEILVIFNVGAKLLYEPVFPSLTHFGVKPVIFILCNRTIYLCTRNVMRHHICATVFDTSCTFTFLSEISSSYVKKMLILQPFSLLYCPFICLSVSTSVSLVLNNLAQTDSLSLFLYFMN